MELETLIAECTPQDAPQGITNRFGQGLKFYVWKTAIIRVLVFGFLMVVSGVSYGQCTIEEMQHKVYKHDGTSLQYTEYVFNNGSQDTVYLWIDQDTVADSSMTVEQKNIWHFVKYLHHPKCELGLGFMIYDGNIYWGDTFPPAPVIGCTFIKKVIPNESFSVIVMNNSVKREDIHYIPRSFVAAHFFKPERLDEFCYDRPFIVVG